MLARNSLCRFAALILLRKRKHLLTFGSTLRDRIDRAYVGRALSQFKTIPSESRNFSGNAQLQSALPAYRHRLAPNPSPRPRPLL